MNEQRWYEAMTPFTSILGLLLIMWSLFNNSLVLTVAIIAVGLLNVAGYGLISRDRLGRAALMPEVCLFLWMFIVVMNIIQLIFQMKGIL
jgi:hypothetical protein